MKFIIFWFLLFILISCEPIDFIDLTNRCETLIVCEYSLDTLPPYPSENHLEYYLSESIRKGETTRFMLWGRNTWKRFIEESPDKSLNVFIYQIDSIFKYNSIDSLKSLKRYHRIEFSIQDLEISDYKIDVCWRDEMRTAF